MSPQDRVRNSADTFHKLRQQAQRDGKYNDQLKSIIDQAENIGDRAGRITDLHDSTVRPDLETVAKGGECPATLPDGRNIMVRIPAGAPDGTVITLNDPPHQWHILIRELPHPRFVRQGPDLYADLPLDPDTALRGGEVGVHTLTGKVMLNVRPGTQPDTRIRLANLGLPLMREPDRRGDIILTTVAKENP